MLTAQELARAVAELAPPELAEQWDNVGLLLDSGEPFDRVLIALDATGQALAEARELGCGAVVTHHPLIFHPARQILAGEPLQIAARCGISVISAHTNYDAAVGGVNDQLAALLGLGEPQPVFGMGRLGDLPQPQTLEQFAKRVKTALSLPTLFAVRGSGAVRRVAVVGGSGGSFVQQAWEAGADTLLTGEAQHHELLLAGQLGLNFVVAGHFATENPAMQGLCSALQQKLQGRALCLLSQKNTDPASVF